MRIGPARPRPSAGLGPSIPTLAGETSSPASHPTPATGSARVGAQPMSTWSGHR